MRTARQPVTLLLLGLLAVALAACTGPTPSGILPSPTPIQRRAASASPQAGASPITIVPNPFARKPEASASPETVASTLRLPSDGRQIVMVDSTDGHGVWVRRKPAGEPLRTWPDGSPMLIIGEDQYAEGRTWRHVATLDGDTGWAAADFLLIADPAMLAANPLNLDALLAPSPSARMPDASLQARVPVAEAPPAAQIVVVVTATPRPVARAAQRQPAPPPPPLANIGQPAAPPAAGVAQAGGAPATPAPTATPHPTATPIKAPQGATSLEVGGTTLSVVGSERGLPIQIGNRPRSGMELLAVRVKVVNKDSAPYALYRGSFRLALSNRTRVEPLAGGDTPMPYSAAVQPGGDLEGTLTFEVPVGTRVDALVWAPERDVTYSLGI